MLKSSSSVELNTRQRLSSAPDNQYSNNIMANGHSNFRVFPNAFSNFQNIEDPYEKTKKKRVILKSREKFPSDFFNEKSGALNGQENQRNSLRSESANLIKSKRSNSVTDKAVPTKTPKFSSGMSIFSNTNAPDKTDETGNRLQTSSSKLLTEEYEGVFLPSQFLAPKLHKLTRSQSLAHCLAVPKVDTNKVPNQTNDLTYGLSSETHSRLDTEAQQSTGIEAIRGEKKGIVRPSSVNKRRMFSGSSFQSTLRIERLRSETNLSRYRDNDNTSQLSTDISTKILPREGQRNCPEKLETSNNELEQLEIIDRARTPEKHIVSLPLIKKDLNKLNVGRLNRQNNNLQAPLSYRNNEDINTERPSYRVSSSYCSGSKATNAPQRIQSQGGTPECFSKRENLKASIKCLQNKQIPTGEHQQTIFSTKNMARFHDSIIKAINQNIPTESRNGENSSLHINRGQQAQENKDQLDLSLYQRSAQAMNEENQPTSSQNHCFLKDRKDPCEFSFSKNFYKDKTMIYSVLPKSVKDQADQLNIAKKLREPNPEYLKSKSKIFVDSDIKKKFPIVRIKHLQN